MVIHLLLVAPLRERGLVLEIREQKELGELWSPRLNAHSTLMV
jgi:hypothetical protein